MATLQKIVIQDFRNIRLQELSFSPNINCISGGNGEGKTNLLDAIWYLSMTKSAFSASDRFNFRYGTSAFALSGTYAMPGGTSARFSIRVADGAPGCWVTAANLFIDRQGRALTYSRLEHGVLRSEEQQKWLRSLIPYTPNTAVLI